MKGSASRGWSVCALVTSGVLGGLAASASGQLTFLPPKDVVTLTNDFVFGWDAGDLDGDGLPDAVYSSFAKVGVVGNLGDGRWEPPSTQPSLTMGDQLADFDGDGRLDLFAGGGMTVEVMLGQGDGSFGPTLVSVGPGGGFGGMVDAAFADYDGDGDTDVLGMSFYLGGVLSSFSTLVTYHEGNGDGTFLDPVLIHTGTEPWTASLVQGDLDADGDLDAALYLPSFFGNGLSLRSFLANGDGTFTTVPTEMPTVLSRGTLADVDGDGLPDFVGEAAGGHDGYVMAGNGDGSFADPVWSYTAMTALDAGIDGSGDFDGDGLPDLLRPAEDAVEVWLNAGDGTFARAALLDTGRAWLGARAADLNADGRCDVVANVAIENVGTALIVVHNTTYAQDAPFEDRGDHLTPGSIRSLQMASGALLPGDAYGFAASDLPEDGVAWLVVGSQELGLPFAGGSIGPSMDIVLGPVATAGAPRWTLEGLWPLGVPSGTTLYTQFWVRDGDGTFASTGTVEVEVP